MGRAIADGVSSVARYADPTALALLPAASREQVERIRSFAKPAGFRERVRFGYHRRQSQLMVARTVAIDDAVREMAVPQLVILGAGLDGRAWRMTELRDSVVFEVDHPDSQRDKRARVAPLTRCAREVRFVPVDFERDDLDAALGAAGHEASQRSTWIWEGVVMYLTRSDIEGTLRVIQRRSAPGSRLVIAYHSPARMLALVGLVLRYLGEPLRSTFTAEAMRELLVRHGFSVVRDEGLHEFATTLAPDVARDLARIRHMRVVTATRAG